jgi:hypothetical protein
VTIAFYGDDPHGTSSQAKAASIFNPRKKLSPVHKSRKVSHSDNFSLVSLIGKILDKMAGICNR